MIRVLIADDQAAVRSGLRLVLAAVPDIDVVAEVGDGMTAVAAARRERPDVCLVDIRMPGLDGIRVTQQLAGPGVADPLAVVILTTFDLDEYVYGALRAGARGFLLKDAGPDLIAQAIRAAAAGDALIAPEVTGRLLDAFAARVPASEPAEPLTAREEDVLALLAAGLTNAEIGARLHLSLGTVKTHLGGVLTKLGMRNRVEAAIWARETGRYPRP